MTYTRFTELLEEICGKDILGNYEDCLADAKSYREYKEFMKEEHLIYNWLMIAFHWENTKQGNDYWLNIYNQLECKHLTQTNNAKQ